jgi:hypothetical protein
MINQKGESVSKDSTEFWGLPIKFEKGEQVIITTAEVVGRVEELAIDTSTGSVYYGVVYPYGSVYLNQTVGYDSDRAWITERALRKIKPKKSFLERFFEEHKEWYETTDLVNRQIESYSKLGNAK